jgi:hypothetical protein
MVRSHAIFRLVLVEGSKEVIFVQEGVAGGIVDDLRLCAGVRGDLFVELFGQGGRIDLVAVGDMDLYGRLEPRIAVRQVADRVESHRRGDLAPSWTASCKANEPPMQNPTTPTVSPTTSSRESR